MSKKKSVTRVGSIGRVMPQLVICDHHGHDYCEGCQHNKPHKENSEDDGELCTCGGVCGANGPNFNVRCLRHNAPAHRLEADNEH